MKDFLCMLLFCVVSLLSSCSGETVKKQTEPVSKVKKMQKEVMDIHDEAMAKMDLIYRLKKQVKGIADSLLEDSTSHAETLVVARKNIASLEVADESMMAWMRSYKAPKDKTEAEAMEYLKAEQEKIEDVKKLMNDNIAGAEAFVKEH